LDAARHGLLLAVAGYDLELQRYEPLMQLRDDDDWKRFVGMVLKNPDEQIAETEKSRVFTEKALLSGNTTRRIMEHALS